MTAWAIANHQNTAASSRGKAAIRWDASRNLAVSTPIFLAELSQEISIHENEIERKISKQRAVINALITAAIARGERCACNLRASITAAAVPAIGAEITLSYEPDVHVVVSVTDGAAEAGSVQPAVLIRVQVKKSVSASLKAPRPTSPKKPSHPKRPAAPCIGKLTVAQGSQRRH
jgi:hypothetical protein